MRINEVEKQLGLSKKSIRFYEENGLLKPSRNKENLYRDYRESDLKQLKKIKFLRSLNTSINELQKLEAKKLTLKDLMESKLQLIQHESERLEKIKSICNDIIINDYNYNNLEVSKYLEKLSVIEKEKYFMNDMKSNKQKKISGAILATILFNLFFLFLMILIGYFQIREEEKMPIVLFIFIMLILFLPQIGTFINLRNRIKEIKEGEEDEALKY